MNKNNPITNKVENKNTKVKATEVYVDYISLVNEIKDSLK